MALLRLQVNADNSQEFMELFNSRKANFPGENDLKGSAMALLRLQDTYKLDTKMFASGNIKGQLSNQSLSAEDCYYNGRESYLAKDFYHCKIWMSQTLSMDDKEYTYFTKFNVMDIDPSNDRIQANYRSFQKLLGSNRRGESVL